MLNVTVQLQYNETVVTFWGRLRGSFVLFSLPSHMSWLSTHLDPPKKGREKKTLWGSLNVCIWINDIFACLCFGFCAFTCSPTLSHSSKVSLSLGRWTTHWISCSTRAVTIWMYIGSPSLSELFSLRTHKVRLQGKLRLWVTSRKIMDFCVREHTLTMGNLHVYCCVATLMAGQ